jgi:phospholipid N-methyltransferase
LFCEQEDDAMKDARLLTASEFLRNPMRVGTAVPASAAMVHRVLDPIDWAAVDLAVEYGPGSGRFTFEMLRRMHAGAHLLVIETGAQFVEQLRSHDDPRLIVVEGSAVDVNRHLARQGFVQADCVVTGLPFSTLDRSEAEAIMGGTAMALRPAGLLAAYQMRTAIRPLIGRHFAAVRHGFEWWNIPPCHLYWATSPLACAPGGPMSLLRTAA